MFNGVDKTKKGSQQLIKETNIRRIFILVSQNDGISRAELANHTKLSPTPISSLADELISAGLVKEAGTGNIPTSGRKPIMLKINPGGGCIVAADLQETGFNIGIFDLNCRLLNEYFVNLTDYDHLGSSLTESISKSIKQSNYKEKQLMGICIGAPGIIDRKNRKVISSTILPIEKNNNFYGELTEAYPDAKIELINESSLSAYTEKEYGRATAGINNLIYIDIHTGIGAGILINGMIYEGSDAIAGEFGHISVDLNGPLCKCGSRGCLETLASIPALIENIEGETGFPTQIINKGNIDEKFSIVAKEYRENNKFAAEVNIMARYIAYGINNAINLINPGAVVIGGKAVELGEKFLGEILRTLSTIGLNGNKETKVILSDFKGNPVTAGGAKYIFNSLF